ncbi:hypothetical protein Pyn_23525 [Prunus yedoensis var. nudiflora]|uniref:Uncharacterized protein n=1 Tax=Prunus yedoensis var. nudiflora TaxID=2094558 RepID=A0A314ZNI4_PRUYE|nr:hypothetical protein Pyn_23525 [Prunus yedoensis var. nudiflora]
MPSSHATSSSGTKPCNYPRLAKKVVAWDGYEHSQGPLRDQGMEVLDHLGAQKVKPIPRAQIHGLA